VFSEGESGEGAKKRKVTHICGRQIDGRCKKEKGHAYLWKANRRKGKKRERSRIFVEGKSTEGAKKEKGHAYLRKANRRKVQKRERSRIFAEGKSTERQKKRKVTHICGRQIDGEAKKEKGHLCGGGFGL